MPNEPDPNAETDLAVRFEAEQQQLLEEQAQERAHREGSTHPTRRVRLMAPNGLEIMGTCESVAGVAYAAVYRDEDGDLDIVHDGETKMYWDCSETDERDGQTVFQDVEGNECLENQLVTDPSYDGSDEDEDEDEEDAA